MIYETGNRVLNQLEKQIGKLALPKILRWIAGFQVLSWALSLISPEFLGWINFDRNAILSGEIWRLLTWVLYPASDFVFFVIIAALFMFFINDGLESEWDSFRLNVYVFASVLFISLGGLIPDASGAGLLLNSIFYSAISLPEPDYSPAGHHPDQGEMARLGQRGSPRRDDSDKSGASPCGNHRGHWNSSLPRDLCPRIRPRLPPTGRGDGPASSLRK